MRLVCYFLYIGESQCPLTPSVMAFDEFGEFHYVREFYSECCSICRSERRTLLVQKKSTDFGRLTCAFGEKTGEDAMIRAQKESRSRPGRNGK